ncbi:MULTISPECIES: DUF982 domain-containing protein [Chelativorans]|jgi:hypothetical protein|uniref:DUF982 domain-containing protein n=1 Tax=Chelativorans TaxID=449972 RepID=UPI000A0047DB
MPIGSWSPPVCVFAGKAGNKRWVVGDAALAARIMLQEWPAHAPKGPANLKARKVLLRCLQGKCEPEQARQAFVAAAEEANILDH